MTDRQVVVFRAGSRRAYASTLLGSVSLLALMAGGNPALARSLQQSASTVAATAAAQQAAIAAAQQAAAAAAQSSVSLARAAAALTAAQAAQKAAAAAASTSNIADGLSAGTATKTTPGLVPYGATSTDLLAGITPGSTTWVGGNAPTQTVSGTTTTVTINQTQQKAIFYWNSFNVSSNTTVNFVQSASNWIAFNRVVDPTASPTQILGHINALGSVYIINGNGIIFGAGAQINVHSLVASTLDIGVLGTDLATRDAYFQNTGIANLNSFSVYDPSGGGAATTFVPGNVTVERGATITANISTDLVPLGSAGSVYLFGANVSNSGTIVAPTGEVGMVAARAINLVPNGYSALPTSVLGTDSSGNPLSFRGTEFQISPFTALYDSTGASKGGQGTYLPNTGAVSHDGVIEASRGIVIMDGDKITLGNPTDGAGHNLIDPTTGNIVQGVISVDTSIDRNAMVILRAVTSITMNGVISSLPYDDGSPALPQGASAGSTVQSFTPAYIEMSAQSNVTVGSTGLISAPSAQVEIRAISLSNPALYTSSTEELFTQGGNIGIGSSTPSAAQTVLLAPGATIDVSGLQNVELPATYNFISFQPRAEFADMPLQKNGVLYGQTLWIDIRDSGTRSDGTTWVGTPLADASGYVNAVGRSIYQLMTAGGSVDIKTDLTTSNGASSVQAAGSIINVAGGSVKFLAGMVPTTELIGSDGHIYSMANADPNITYVGIVGQSTVDHAHWGVTQSFSTQTETYSPGYTDGQAAGSVSITTVNPVLGTMYFGSTAGSRQIASGSLPSQGSFSLTTPWTVQIGSAASTNFVSQVPTITLSADTFSGYGLSALTIEANSVEVSSGATLNLAPGGKFSVTAGGAIDVAGTVAAAGGAVSLVTDRAKVSSDFAAFAAFASPTNQSGAVIAANVYVEGTIDVSGRFVNDTGRFGTDALGPGYINGGTISITTHTDSSASGSSSSLIDSTGSILLASGSLLDVSSGGYISPAGKPTMASTQAMAGKAGSISLSLYQGGPWISPDPLPFPDPTKSSVAVIELDGALRGYGFASNGSLTLAAADTIRIGGSLQPGETSSIQIGGVPSVLPVSLFTSGGFSSYTIISTSDGWSAGYTSSTRGDSVIVSAGVNLTLQQQNLSSAIDYSNVATGTKLGQQTSLKLAVLPDDQRQAVNLTLEADTVLIDTGARIVTDPKASIFLGGNPTLKDPLNPTNLTQANLVDLRGAIVDHGGTVFINSVATVLESQALVDLSGTFIASSTFGLPSGSTTSGTLLAGGTFTIESAALNQALSTGLGSTTVYGTTYVPTSSYVVADAGAQVDVSGYAGTVQALNANGTASPVWSWSDAGTVVINAARFAWGGSFTAMGGRSYSATGVAQADSRANNGTIILGGGNVSLQQDMTAVNAALANFQHGVVPTSLVVSADQLAPFDNVYLYAENAPGGAVRIFTDLSGSTYGYQSPTFNTLSITGSLNWTVANRLHIAAGEIIASTAGSVVQVSAPYVSLTNVQPLNASNQPQPPTVTSGSSTFTVSAQTVDVEGASLSGFGKVSLISSGDIRLSTPKVADGYVANSTTTTTADASTFTGLLLSGGDILLSAQRIYPVTSVTFTIQTPGNVQFTAPANSNTAIPLSAGGGITVIANTIDQAGNLFAPQGNITLGNSATQSVTLESGSLTSVTLIDTTVPYGATVDGTNWYYNASLNPLSAPPAKGIVLAGANVAEQSGSKIDVRGGGDLQAMEWIAGKGGSRDTLTTTPSGQTVYALVPSQDSAIAAIDIQFLTSRSPDVGKTVVAGDVDPLVGTQITIAGGGGIPAGTYTLYPAHYATLPGAMRVVTYGSNLGQNITSGTTLTDGTVLVTGYTTQSTAPGKQSSGQTIFAIQTSAVWQSYSEYSFTSANSYFASLATKSGGTPPALPMDAGRLAVIAQQSILLSGVSLAQPGQDSSGNTGRGGDLDISAPQLEVVGHTQYINGDIMSGYVGLDVTQLNGFESILIGGQRVDSTATTSTGTKTVTLITPTATNVVVDTQGDALTAPEVLMVAQQVGQWQESKQYVSVGSGTNNVLIDIPVYQPVAGTGTVTIMAGSVINSTGVVHAGLGRTYQVVSSTQPAVTAATLAAALGGTLSASGTEIDNVDLANLPAYWFGSSATSHVANATSQLNLAYYANGGAQQPGRGALFVATNDPTLVVTGPTATGTLAPTLTIKFANVTSTDATTVGGGAPTGAVTGTLTLAGGDTTGSGQVTIQAGASITTNTLTLQATASTNAIAVNTTDLHASQVNLTAQTIALGAGTSGQSLVVASNSSQFANVQSLALHALSGPISVNGDFNPGTTNLTLDANGIALGQSVAPGSTVTVAASGTITLKNTYASPATGGTAATTDTTLDLSASEIDLGTGPVNGNTVASSLAITGFSTVNMTASSSMVVKGPGTLTLGLASGDTVNLNVATPIIQVTSATTASGAQGFAISTSAGNVSVTDVVSRTTAASRPTDSSQIGGSLTITAANIDIASTIQAQAGTITLDAIAGNVELHTGAYLAAGGYKKTLVDVDTYVSGGKVVLYADTGNNTGSAYGNVTLDAGSVVDVAQPASGKGYGGEIDVSTLRGNATFNGQLLGSGGAGLGGKFSLDTQGSADLTALSDILLAGGITGSISIQTHTGNLVLAQGHTLQANAITLVADDPTQNASDPTQSQGQIIISGTINADGYAGKTADGSGEAGGTIGLFGYSDVKLTSTARIYARTTHSDQKGGDVTLGLNWYADGTIDLQAGSVIDVSGTTSATGGTVTLRAPLDGHNNVQIGSLDGTITGARSVTVNGFISIDTSAQPGAQGIDGSSLTTANGTPVVWDGLIDPAGSVSSDGLPVNFGSWTNVTGTKLNVTPGSGYTAPPNISVLPAGASTATTGTAYVDPQTGATYYQVTDPVTGTTFRSSLQVSSVNVTSGGSYTSVPTVTITAANGTLPSWGTSAKATAVMGLNPFSVSGVAIDNSANGKVVRLFDANGTQLGTGTAVVSNGMLTGVTGITLLSGVVVTTLPVKLLVNYPNLFNPTTVTTGFSPTMTVTGVTVSGGAGYSGGVNVGFSGGGATATATMGAAVTVTSVTKGYTSSASLPTVTITGTGTGASASFGTQTTGYTGATDQNDVFTPSVASNIIPIATSDVFKGSSGTDSASLTIAPYQAHVLLYSDVLANFVQGNGIQGTDVTGSYGFSAILDRLNAPGGLVSRLGASVVHFQPGVDLVNSSSTINSGNITVVSNWNLAAGTAGNLQTTTNPTTSQPVTYFDPASSTVNFTYRLVTPWGSLESGSLTLRTAGDIIANASISDGFFQTANYLDPGYQAWVAANIASDRKIDAGNPYTYYVNSYSTAPAIAPYNAAGNSISPSSQDLATADLFPHQLLVCCTASGVTAVTSPSSWSYRLTAGADLTSANPSAVVPLANAVIGNTGDIIIANHSSYQQTLIQGSLGISTTVTVNLPTMIRTGTGDISITAARDVVLQDTVAPGVIYAAGVNTALPADPGYSVQTVNGVSTLVAANPDGFFEPQVLAYDNSALSSGAGAGLYYGPPTAAAFPEKGGNVTVTAQRDIIGFSGSGNKTVQYYQPWLLSEAGVPTGASGATIATLGAGVFAPLGTSMASQTAWWIQYGSFQQGILSAGGNVTVTAGRDLIDVSVSLPTTGRAVGGLSATSTPVTIVYDSGNMVVSAGRNILGGSFYEGSGSATITAGGSIGQNGTVSRFASSTLLRPDVPLLAVDTGQITMTASGSVTMAGVVNPAELHAQSPTFANPFEGSSAQLPLYMDTYGPDSKVRLVAVNGDLTITIAPTAIALRGYGAAAAMYPASFEALSLNGNLTTTGISDILAATVGTTGTGVPMPGIVLAPSLHGTFELLANGSVDLTFGYPQNTSTLLSSIPRPFISAGASLIETAFDPYQPNSGFDGSSAGSVLAHATDTADGLDTVARIYAATGNILATGSYGPRIINDTYNGYQRIEINRPAKIYAGTDIVDLNVIVENIHTSDVSTIDAGRNIYYTGYNNGGGLQVAGPGYFVVTAGGSIGPFLPAAHDNATEAQVQEGIASVGNDTPTAVGNTYVSGRGGSIGIYDQTMLGPYSDPRRNALLTAAAGTSQGASVAVLFGAQFGADWQAMINTYIDPANAANVAHNYIGELQTFLATIGEPAASSDPNTVFQAFTNLSPDLQHVFIDQVFFAELKAVGVSQQSGTAQYQRGYTAINTMFPSSLGYTANALGGGTNGANKLVSTGDLNLLHATIQTRQGGSISILGPGGNILVGSLATEANPKLKLSDLGILTLGGGAINTFTDQSVLVNSSRVLTTQGGDVLMWSSNGDLDAGRGSKTTLLLPPLQVLYDQNDYQSVDLSGFVTGSGIGTLQTSSLAEASSLYLLAPRGTVDAGTAGVRVSGNLVIVAPVVLNGSNFSVQGTTSNSTAVAVPNIGALTTGSNTAAAGVKSADSPTGSTNNQEQPSIFLVEVLGYGGGDGQNSGNDDQKKKNDGNQ